MSDLHTRAGELNPQNRGFLTRTRSILFPRIAPTARVITETIKSDAKRTGGILKSAFSPPQPHPDVAAESDPDRRFRIAMETSGRTEADLPEITLSAGRRLELYCILTMIAALWMFIAPVLGLGGVSGIGFIDLLFPLGLTAFMASKAFAASVALYRIQRRSMVPIREFLRDRNAWLGGKPTLGAGKVISSLAIGIGLSALLPFPALAQGVATATASGVSSFGSGLAALTTFAGAEDLSLEWLRRLFPGMANIPCPPGAGIGASIASCTASDSDVLGAMMGAMNSILLGIGSFMMAWHTIIATVQTAHEGKVMGERWHTIWAPIRVVVGFGLLVPIKGYCGIQFAVLMVIVMGYNMANAMWSAYVDKALSGEMASVAVSMTPNMGLDLAHSVMVSETCVAIMRAHQQGVSAQSGSNVTPSRLAATAVAPVATPPSAGVAAPGTDGQRGARIWSYGAICGSIRTAADNPPLNTSSAAASSGTQAGITDAAVRAGNAAYTDFLRARDREIGVLIEAVRAANVQEIVVRSVRAGNTPGAASANPSSEEELATLTQRYQRVREAGEAFDRAITTASQSMVSVINSQGSAQFKQRAAALGWASAGALNTALLRAAARASELTSAAAPGMSGPDLAAFQRATARRNQAPEVQQRLEASMNYLRGMLIDFDQRGTASPQSVAIGADMQGRNIVAQVFKPLTDNMARFLTDDLGRIDPVRPMASIQTMGTHMLGVAWSMFAGWIAVNSAAAGAGGSVFGLAGANAGVGALGAVASLYVPIMIALFICGALHAYVLPMIPFLIWTYAILAVVSLAAELVIAAPLAAFMHLRMDGNELINEPQKTIYTMTFNALLRPSLLLCGLVVANLVFAIMANYLNKLFGVAVTTTNGDSIIGIMGFVTMTILVFYMHYQLAVRSMQLISAVPSTVSEIIGARDQDRDAHGEGTKVFAAVGNMTTRATNVGLNATTAAMAKKPEGEQPKGPGIRAADGGGGGGGGGGGVRQAAGGNAPPPPPTSNRET